ncbi:MAG TPA: DinB family protein [Actinomycetota bacterium]|nr:DinB family protein [Actinomycetota bacterium]
MSARVLQDALGHHVWATLRLMDVCLALSPEELETSVPGTYGSILDTMRHLVGGDASYLFTMTGRTIDHVDEQALGLSELRAVMEGHRAAWMALVDQDIDPATVVVRRRDDGSETHAPMGIRLAQALHHGTDHRSQICTALTALGIQAPDIDVWDFAWDDGRLVEIPAKT